MGRHKLKKPRKGYGSGHVSPDVKLEMMQLSEATLKEPLEVSMATRRVVSDPAVKVLRTVYETCSREDYYEAAQTKGLTVKQAHWLESLLMWVRSHNDDITKMEADLIAKAGAPGGP